MPQKITCPVDRKPSEYFVRDMDWRKTNSSARGTIYMFLFRLPGHLLLNMVELFNIQGSKIPCVAESVQEKFWLTFSERTSVQYVIYEQLITVYFAERSYAKWYFQTLLKLLVRLLLISTKGCIQHYFPASQKPQFFDCTSSFCSCNAEEHMEARKVSHSSLERNIKKHPEQETETSTEKHPEQGALQQVRSSESLAEIHCINVWFPGRVLKLLFYPKYTIFLSHIFLLLFRGSGARDSPVSLNVDIVVMFQQQ